MAFFEFGGGGRGDIGERFSLLSYVVYIGNKAFLEFGDRGDRGHMVLASS